MEMKVVKAIKKLPSIKQVNDAIDAYEQEHQGKPVFLELLSKMGMLWDDWCEMKENNPHCYQVRILEMYQQHIIVQMEKLLMYESKFHNVNALMFYLKKSQPNRFGDKTIELKTKSPTKSMYDELKNESEIDLMKLSVC